MGTVNLITCIHSLVMDPSSVNAFPFHFQEELVTDHLIRNDIHEYGPL